MTGTYLKRPTCRCGYSIVRDDIPLGKVYELRKDRIVNCTLLCGSCRERRTIKLIQDSNGDWLPLEMFQLQEPN